MTLVKLIEELGGPRDVSARASEARSLMVRAGGRFLSLSKIEEVIASAGETIGVEMTNGEIEAIREVAREVLRCRQAGRRWKAKVVAHARSNVAAHRMAPVIGEVTAAVVVAQLGDPQAYSSAKSLVKSAGANLREKSSGKHKGELKLTKRGPSEVRFYLYLAALRLLQRDPVVRAWYERKVARDGGRYKNRAVVGIMRKLLKALWHVARGERFDSTLLFDTSRLTLPC
jgi:transposase